MAMEIKHLQTSEAKIDLSPQKDYFAEWQMSELKASKAEKEIRRLKRALFIALAYKAKYKKYWYCELLEQESIKILPDNKKTKKYNTIIGMCQKSEVKCRAKAEEYK